MIVFDIETDGLLKTVSKVHCLVTYDTTTDKLTAYNNQGNCPSIVDGLLELSKAEHLIGHNIIGYDLPVLKLIYPHFKLEGKPFDTLVLSRLFHPNMYEIDKKREWKDMPTNLYGRHSLKSYGYRLGEYKGDFGETTDWASWTQEMQDYCIQDVKVTMKLCEHFRIYLTGAG